jgi:hypothetical protein
MEKGVEKNKHYLVINGLNLSNMELHIDGLDGCIQ